MGDGNASFTGVRNDDIQCDGVSDRDRREMQHCRRTDFWVRSRAGWRPASMNRTNMIGNGEIEHLVAVEVSPMATDSRISPCL